MSVSRAAPHFWEEPVISGERGSGTIFFAGCNLRCIYCQNHSISREGRGVISSIEDVAQMCLSLQAQGVMNINFVTPTHFAPSIRRSIKVARKNGLKLPIVWNTSGYERVESVAANAGCVDVYLTDFKYGNEELSLAFSGVSDYCHAALEALDEMVVQTGPPKYDVFMGQSRMIGGVIVRHLVLPGHVEDSKSVISLLHERYGNLIRLSIMNQYTPVLNSLAKDGSPFARSALTRAPELGKHVTQDEYEQCLDHADAIGVSEYFWQDGETCSESFIPDFGV